MIPTLVFIFILLFNHPAQALIAHPISTEEEPQQDDEVIYLHEDLVTAQMSENQQKQKSSDDALSEFQKQIRMDKMKKKEPKATPEKPKRVQKKVRKTKKAKADPTIKIRKEIKKINEKYYQKQAQLRQHYLTERAEIYFREIHVLIKAGRWELAKEKLIDLNKSFNSKGVPEEIRSRLMKTIDALEMELDRQIAKGTPQEQRFRNKMKKLNYREEKKIEQVKKRQEMTQMRDKKKKEEIETRRKLLNSKGADDE